ncbi:MAG: iron-sulfur cluster assembly scaffold protein [Candidatus Aenigmarchaeota archaeon]|nr:iron-sulfur cluster assembly scaffold protein [Candidatus Aenigmarchaeota archaeon]
MEKIDTTYAGEGMYREFILDHYKSPRNSGSIENADIIHKEVNPLCGDQVEIFLKLNGSGTIQEVKHLSRGCAISVSSMSLLSETLKGKSLKDAAGIRKEDIIGMLGIPVGPVRIKCALLCLYALKDGIVKYESAKP